MAESSRQQDGIMRVGFGTHAVPIWLVVLVFSGLSVLPEGSGSVPPQESPDDKPSRNVRLTSENFDTLVSNGTGNVWFVKFHAPWCGHCKAMAPAWEELSIKLAGKAMVGDVDVTQESWLSTQFYIKGEERYASGRSGRSIIDHLSQQISRYGDSFDMSGSEAAHVNWLGGTPSPGMPTLMFFTDSKVYEYSGRRDVASLQAFALAGWKAAKGNDLPRDRPWYDKAYVSMSHYWWVVLIVTIFATVMFCYYACSQCASVDEEHIARRREFEARLKSYENKMRERKAADEVRTGAATPEAAEDSAAADKKED